MSNTDYSGPEYTSTDFNELPHADDWADATYKDDSLEPVDEASKAFLRNVEIRLNLRYEDDDVQQWVRENQSGTSDD